MAKKKTERTNPEDLKLPIGGVDTHAHIAFPEYSLEKSKTGQDLASVMARAHASGLYAIGNIFASAAHWRDCRGIFSPRPKVFFQLGIHPIEANLFTAEEESAILEAVKSDTEIRAIGEIGIDYYWDEQPPELQKTVFASQLKMAKKLDLPVSIHCRDAWDDTLAILEAEGFRGRPLLWHCFGGNRDMAEAILSRGWHISIPGPVTFKKNDSLREAVSIIPADRLHLETDCPYLAPEPWRGQQNEPALVVFTAREVARCKGMPIEELWLTCGENSKKLFGL